MSDADTVTAEATSRDGRTFSYRQRGATALLPGDLVVLHTADDELYLGQALEQAAAAGQGEAAAGIGLVISVLDGDGVRQGTASRPFASASVAPATVTQLEALQRSRSAALPIGTWNSCGVEVAARLRAQGFGRHTFLCGQSGSGKTYALGVILEQLLLGTDLRMVVLDPNADFVRLGQTLPTVAVEAAKRWEVLNIRVLGANASGAEPLRLRFMTMPRQAQAALLRLDPLVDRGEYNQFLHMMETTQARDIGGIVRQLREGGPDERSLAERIENLGLHDWEVWAGEQASAAEVVAGGARLTVLNLSGFQDPYEPVAVSLDLVERLWAQRETRTPTLIVLDEAHNICPSEPQGSMQAAVVERLIQIAAEGRKYGLWLLLSTQRPSKIHPQVLSQCDNLVLMRMNSRADIAELTEVFGFVPPAMLRSAQFFVQGEALVAGGFVPTPAIIHMGDRLTFQGGSDVAVPVG